MIVVFNRFQIDEARREKGQAKKIVNRKKQKFMSEKPQQQKLEPVFDFTSQHSILLDQGDITISVDGKSCACRGEARLDLVPLPSIHFYASFDSPCSFEKMTFVAKPETLCFKGKQIAGFPLSHGGLSVSGEGVNLHPIKWCPSMEPVIALGDDTTHMNRITFHLFNFPSFRGHRGSTEKDGQSIHAIQHIDLKYDGWEIELKSLTSTQESIKQLKSDGGNRLTHVAGIRKNDDLEFTGKEASEILDALRNFLSFSIGCWCHPVCSVGFDGNETRVWESWTSPKAGWKSSISWFDYNHGEQLAQLFPLFMKKWTDDSWREMLREIIYLYLAANDSSRGIDIGIIVSQAALERFSFEFSVNDRKLLTSDGFKKLWASDQYRLLFSSLNLPLDIPSETNTLLTLSKQNQSKWLDAPMALTEIRNSLIHPDPTKRGKTDSALLVDAWYLILWYIELGILAICEYNGTYGNRLHQNRCVGQVDQVPWQNKQGNS